MEQIFSNVWQNLEQQTWLSALYVVATPIGNLADMSLRAVYCLQQADLIACEDTRSSQSLLNYWGIRTPLKALHRHNEQSAGEEVLSYLAQGKKVALISDAGSPAISDPGGKLVRSVLAANFRVVPVPGACAVVSALMASGLTDDQQPGFSFAGFVPTKSRRAWLEHWLKEPQAVVFYEAPHRIVDLLEQLHALCHSDREVVLARELTKRFEEITRQPISQLVSWITQDKHRQLGEFVVIVSPDEHVEVDQAQEQAWLVTLLEEGLSAKDVSRIVSKMTGTNKKALYQRILMLKSNATDKDV